MALARIMPSLCLKRYVQSVWTRADVSEERERGVVAESRLDGIASQVLFSRIWTTAEG
jgi:hypothetical protein